MLAPCRSAAPTEPQDSSSPDDQEVQLQGSAPHIGMVRGGGRPTVLRHMPASMSLNGNKEDHETEAFETNHPSCIFCGKAARPAILMFGDSAWQDVESQRARWSRWSSAVQTLASETREKQVLKVAILEIGAGGNVTTVRGTAERELTGFLRAGASAALIRVNPDLPLADDEELSNNVISVMTGGLEALTKIDGILNNHEVCSPAAEMVTASEG